MLIWQSRNLAALPFMYSPVTDFLVAAFKPHAAVVRGAGTRRNDSAAFAGNWSRLRAGDIFVWVGLSMSQAPWLELGHRGVRRILYQTEPVHHCAARRVGRFAVDELWDFSHHNLEACRAPADGSSSATLHPRGKHYGSAADAPRVLRFVPPGALEPPPPPAPAADAQRLFFFGNPSDGPLRKACFRSLRRLLGDRLEYTFSTFSEARWRTKVLARANVFVNLHKECTEAHNPITFRVPKLLNAGRFVLSERAHPDDEREYAGIVSFHDNVSALAAAFTQLVESGQWEPRARAASAAFRERFAPREVFRRARIIDDLLQPRTEL